MATIRKRGQSWQVQIRRTGHPPINKSFKRKPDAETWARSLETDADRHGLHVLDVRQLQQVSVQQLLERYRDFVTVRKRGREAETYMINAMLREKWVRLSLAAVSPSIFAKYRDTRLGSVQPATVRVFER